MPYINVGHENSSPIDIHYDDIGTGRPIVLIHGFPLNGRSWERQIPPLLNAGFRVVTYDRRGFGKSSQPSVGYEADTFTSDLNRLLTELDLHDAVLCGFSMGGGEVARYLGTYGADRVRAAVFVSGLTPFLLKTPETPNAFDQSVFDGLQAAIATDRLAWLTAFYKDFYNVDVLLGERVSEEVVRDSWNVSAGASPIATWAGPQTWRTDFRKDLKTIDVPTLVMHGAAESFRSRQAAHEQHETVKDSQYVVIADAPHGYTWTHADEVNRALLEFVRTPRVAA